LRLGCGFCRSLPESADGRGVSIAFSVVQAAESVGIDG
jgi:hypothetical protein